MSKYYINEKTHIDEYGVDHSNFSLRDEIDYNMNLMNQQNNFAVTPIPKTSFSGMNHQNNSTVPNSNWNGVASSVLTGFADGAFGGVERYANALSGGAYGYGVDQFMGNAYTDRQNKLQNQANQTGLGTLNNISNRILDISGIGTRLLLKK